MAFDFGGSAATLTIGTAYRAALALMRATVPRWAIPAAVITIANIVAAGVLLRLLGDAAAGLPALVSQNAQSIAVDPAAFTDLVGRSVAAASVATAVLWLISMVGSLLFAALAIDGLRGGRLAIGEVFRRGVAGLVASLVVSLAIVGGFLLVMVVATVLPFLLLVAFPVLLVALVYVQARMSFVVLAAMDGAGVLGSVRRSWQISEGAVLRVIGWYLVAALVGFLAGIPLGILSGLVPVVGSAIAGFLGIALSAYLLLVTAGLYESQRLRAGTQPA